jgi:hypothetical protein
MPHDGGIAGTNDKAWKWAGNAETLLETKPPIAVRCIPRVLGVRCLALMYFGGIGQWKMEIKGFMPAGVFCTDSVGNHVAPFWRYSSCSLLA